MKTVAKAVVVVFALAWLVKEVFLPLGTAALLSGTYMELAYECDTAMESSWYFSQDNRVDSKSEQTQMLVCHEYDKTRKLLLISGLPEDYLSWLGLRSLELYQRPPEEFVKQHRFTRR